MKYHEGKGGLEIPVYTKNGGGGGVGFLNKITIAVLRFSVSTVLDR
jgi:hypothetical protein